MTPSYAALQDLDINLDGVHKITGLRMIAGRVENSSGLEVGVSRHMEPFGHARTGSHLLESATQAGAKIFYETEALPNFSGERAGYLWIRYVVC